MVIMATNGLLVKGHVKIFVWLNQDPVSWGIINDTNELT